MKHLYQAILCFSVLALVLFSCKKEYSYEVPGGGGVSGSYQWSFTEGSNSYKGPMDTAYADTLGTVHTLTLMGHSSDSKDIISLQIFADTIKVGTYVTNKCSFDYLRSGLAVYGSDLTAIGDFTVSITAMDSISITGTFSGNALDTAKKKKSITDGKFKVRFKSGSSTTTPPPVNNCNVSVLTYCDSVSGTPFYAFTSLYNNFNLVKTILATDSSQSPAVNDNTFVVSTSGGKVMVDGSKQYFTTDANGRVTGFVGYEDPTNYSSQAITVTYAYDAAGHLVDRMQTYTATPALTLETVFTYSNNQLTTAVVKYLTLKVAQIDYTYDGQTIKNALDLHPHAYELMLFQAAINAGVGCDHPLVKAVETQYDPTTNPATVLSVSTALLKNYNIDANKYVKSFTVTGDDFVAGSLQSGTLYKLSYHCN